MGIISSTHLQHIHAMHNLKYPIGMQTFSEIRERGFAYVDKTEYVYQLVTETKHVFLSRPRRFGKSLLLSTIESYFNGDKELFDGLAISRLEQDWEVHPVLRLDFSGSSYSSYDDFISQMDALFHGFERAYGITPLSPNAFGPRFGNIISCAFERTGHKVVILVDEYDKALLETVDNEPLQKKIRDVLRGIYGNLKAQDRHIRFAMLTGVTRFGHLSIFSDLNNLRDISMSEQFAGLCGVTEKELHQYLDTGVHDFAKARGITVEEAYDSLKVNYDGYHFVVENSPDIYNPFSLLCALSEKRINDYWFRTGTPTFLMKLVTKGKLPLRKLDRLEVSVRSLSDVSFDLRNHASVLYQSGYLTIKAYDAEFDMVKLGFPNLEVERGFYEGLLSAYAGTQQEDTQFSVRNFVDDAREGNIGQFMLRLQSFFADFPYDSFGLNNLEQHYQDVIYILMKLLGFYTHVEYRTSSGRIDLLIENADYVYIMELKIDKSAQEALEQIDRKGYALPFQCKGKKIVKIGANFSSETRTLDDWIIIE